ncbi:hypothetical protein M9H77_27080 [Catharanthus roseus]|uniref:Uncharacterized protein n=1 Tax=Catharanthus roseus TaxID=4058 RepID=A0ACC0ABG8_CATRO|nr:hypothetical protein M9H77_27080 [Catharanthus roseus]
MLFHNHNVLLCGQKFGQKANIGFDRLGKSIKGGPWIGTHGRSRKRCQNGTQCNYIKLEKNGLLDVGAKLTKESSPSLGMNWCLRKLSSQVDSTQNGPIDGKI